MKVIAINGSPRKNGNTFHALKIVANELEKEGIEVEIVDVGSKIIRGCTACNSCAKNKNEKCIIDDGVNEIVQKIKNVDGVIFGSPVHYAAIGGTMKAFMDRAFYVAGVNGGMFRHKVGASVIAVRRSGGLPAFSMMNNYINYSEMIMPTSNYWSVIHGTAPGEALEDKEGVQIMRVLGKNMAWIMKLIEHSKSEIKAPEQEKKEWMSFIR